MEKTTRGFLGQTIPVIIAVFAFAAGAAAQDPVKADPKHYKVTFENENVRILRISVPPHEGAPMHSHPASVLIWITDSHIKLTHPDGKTEEAFRPAGQTNWSEAETHAGENIGETNSECVQVEFKKPFAKPATPKPAPKAKSH
jgi:quercetin dioxygenase-like cupin family protein